MTFQETVQILMKIFGQQSSLSNTRRQCLNLMKKDCEVYTTFASTVNRYCEKFQLNETTSDVFKCLIFLQGLTSPSEKEVNTRLLTKLEQDQKITLQSLAEECQHSLNLRADTAKIEEWDISNIHSIKKKSQGKKNIPFFKINPCYGCENCIYLKAVHLNTKNATLVGTKDTNFHTADLEGEIFQKRKNGYSSQLKKYKENI